MSSEALQGGQKGDLEICYVEVEPALSETAFSLLTYQNNKELWFFHKQFLALSLPLFRLLISFF